MSKFWAIKDDVQTVPYVDLERYMGLWYEIASYPKWFEKGLTDVSAYYAIDGNSVNVINSGYKNGKLKRANGRAAVVEGWGNARLKVSFFRPFYGKYWVVDLAPDYSWAVVSHPRRSSLWILCRTKTMDEACYESILNRLASNGFDTSLLVRMHHSL